MEVAENPAKSRHGLIKLRIMKKVLVLLAIVAFVACFTSCDKECVCRTYAAGIVVDTDDDVDLESGKKCSDLNAIVVDNDGNKNGVECK